MKTVRKILETDSDGNAHVEVPAGVRGTIEVTVSWRELAPAAPDEPLRQAKRAELELLAGALAEDPVVRPPQPVVETRLPVE